MGLGKGGMLRSSGIRLFYIRISRERRGQRAAFQFTESLSAWHIWTNSVNSIINFISKWPDIYRSLDELIGSVHAS